MHRLQRFKLLFERTKERGTKHKNNDAADYQGPVKILLLEYSCKVPPGLVTSSKRLEYEYIKSAFCHADYNPMVKHGDYRARF